MLDLTYTRQDGNGHDLIEGEVLLFERNLVSLLHGDQRIEVASFNGTLSLYQLDPALRAQGGAEWQQEFLLSSTAGFVIRAGETVVAERDELRFLPFNGVVDICGEHANDLVAEWQDISSSWRDVNRQTLGETLTVTSMDYGPCFVEIAVIREPRSRPSGLAERAF
jgi:hypothetical protein